MSIGRRGGANSYIVISGGAGNPQVLAGTADPSAGGGVAAAEGSIYLRYGAGAGELWLKTGAADTAWTQITGGAASPTLAFFGNGDNGSQVLSGDVNELEMWYEDCDTNGFDMVIQRLFCRGTLTVRNGSSINQNGASAVGSTGGATRIANLTGVGGGGVNGTGGNGVPGNSASSVAGWGGSGGSGGSGAGGASPGGAGGTNAISGEQSRPFSYLELASSKTTGRFLGPDGGDYGRISGGASGGSGGGNRVEPPGNRSGGGSGSGGNVIIVCARHIVVEAGGAIEANGGNGGPGEDVDCGGGGGGGGGVVLLCYETLVNNGTIQAVGGAGGASGGGTGVAGSPGAAQVYKGGVYHLPTI
jgi:hypothetical protein